MARPTNKGFTLVETFRTIATPRATQDVTCLVVRSTSLDSEQAILRVARGMRQVQGGPVQVVIGRASSVG